MSLKESSFPAFAGAGPEQTTPGPSWQTKRTRFLEEQGYRIRRFWNDEVLSNLEGVCAMIARDLQRHLALSRPIMGAGTR
jgi:Protein of unknown function (DUF559)